MITGQSISFLTAKAGESQFFFQYFAGIQFPFAGDFDTDFHMMLFYIFEPSFFCSKSPYVEISFDLKTLFALL